MKSVNEKWEEYVSNFDLLEIWLFVDTLFSFFYIAVFQNELCFWSIEMVVFMRLQSWKHKSCVWFAAMLLSTILGRNG